MSDIIILNEDKKYENENVGNEVIVEQKTLLDKVNDFILSMQSIKTKEKVIFYRLLATMTNAGMSLLKSISVLEKQEKNKVLKTMLGRFMEELKAGANLSSCLELYPFSFENAEVGIIKSGEKTGKLNSVLADLATQVEKVASLSGKIKGAMMYPFFILIVVIGVITVMMTMVVPKLLEIFEDKSDFPASTKILMGLSDIFTNYWYLIILFFCSSFFMIWVWKRTHTGKYLFDQFLLKVPVFGGITEKVVLSKFARVFSGLLGSGVSVVECLRISSEVVGNEVYRQRLLLLSEDVKQGIKMWESLDGDKLFPDMMVQMIQIGEETAKLDSTILKIAEFYDEQVNNTIGILNKLLEPFIIVTLAVIVGFIAVGIMQPIMNLADTISNK